MKNICLIIGCLLLCRCGDADLFRFDKLAKPEGWEPNMTLPLAYADFSLWDALNQGNSDSASIRQDEDGKLYLECRRNKIFQLNAEDIYSMHAEDMSFMGSFPINHSHFATGEGTQDRPHRDTMLVPYVLETIPENVTVEEAILSVKSMSVIVANNAKIGGNLVITCKNLYALETGERISFTIPLDPNQMNFFYGTEIPNLRADLQNQRIVPLEFALTVTDTTQAIMGQNVIIDIETTGVDYKNANMTIPIEYFPIESGTFSPDIEFLNSISGDFQFVDPELYLTARSKGLGMNFELEGLKLTGYNGERSCVLESGQKFQFIGESQNLKELENILDYNTSNSNIKEFAALPPKDKITYEDGVLKGGGKTVLYAGGHLDMDLTMRMPLAIEAERLVYYDTIRNLDLKEADKILAAKLKIEGENQIRMDMQIPGLYLIGKDQTMLDSIMSDRENDVFKAATGNQSTLGKIVLEMSEKNLRHLSKSEYIVLKLIAKSPKGKEVVLDANSGLSIKLSLDAKVNMGDILFD